MRHVLDDTRRCGRPSEVEGGGRIAGEALIKISQYTEFIGGDAVEQDVVDASNEIESRQKLILSHRRKANENAAPIARVGALAHEALFRELANLARNVGASNLEIVREVANRDTVDALHMKYRHQHQVLCSGDADLLGDRPTQFHQPSFRYDHSIDEATEFTIRALDQNRSSRNAERQPLAPGEPLLRVSTHEAKLRILISLLDK